MQRGIGRLPSLTTAFVACLTCTSLPSQSLGAQSVIGTVLDANTSAPLPGVLISLLDPDGERVRAVLSDEVGHFTMDVGRFGRFSIRAERIGLRATTSASFDLFSMEPRFERILMGDRAVEITGLVVDTRVKQCRNDASSAVLIQRWWQEIRTALDVSTVVQDQALAQFQVERFERQWGPRLERILSDDRSMEVILSNQPFVSAEADFLAEGGFVQGDMMGQREYYAPDAAVLLSDVFLNQHCFSIVSNDDDDRLIGLAFEPTRSNDVPEIRGTLWVDSVSAELQNLDFRYVNLEGLPENESGGLVAFDYLPSGAWVVHDSTAFGAQGWPGPRYRSSGRAFRRRRTKEALLRSQMFRSVSTTSPSFTPIRRRGASDHRSSTSRSRRARARVPISRCQDSAKQLGWCAWGVGAMRRVFSSGRW